MKTSSCLKRTVYPSNNKHCSFILHCINFTYKFIMSLMPMPPLFNIKLLYLMFLYLVVKCPDPIRRSNSEIVEIFHFINGYATYQCKTGFTFEDGTTTRTILCIDAGNQEGFWNIQPPDCQGNIISLIHILICYLVND